MPTNETVTEILRIKESGIDEVTARLKAYAAEIDEAAKRSKVLQGLMDDGSYARRAEQVAVLNRGYQQGSAHLRVQAEAMAAANGQAARHLQIMQQLSRSSALINAGVANRVAAATLGSGAGVKHAVAMGGFDRRREVIEATTRNQVAAADLGSGATAKHAADMTALNRQLALMQGRGKVQFLSADLTSGAFLKNAQEAAALNKELAALERHAGLQRLVAEHGQLGAVLRANQREVGFLSNTAVGAFQSVKGFGLGLMHMGLQGTVEGYRLELAWTRIGQQIAGIAVPAINSVARALTHVSQWFRTLNGDQQKMIMYAGLFAVALGPAVRMAMLLGTALRAVGAIGGTLGSVFGATTGRIAATTAAVNTASAASQRMIAGMSTAAALSGTGTGLGAAVIGTPGAGRLAIGTGIGIVASELGYGREAMWASLALGSAHGAVEARSLGLTRGRGARLGAGRMLAPVAAGVALDTLAHEGPTYYRKARSEGLDKVSSTGLSIFASLNEVGANFFGLDKDFRKYAFEGIKWLGRNREKPPVVAAEGTLMSGSEMPRGRTDVHPMTTDLLEGGESARLVQKAVLMHGAGEAGEGGGDKNIDDLIDFLGVAFKGVVEALSHRPIES